MWVFLLKPGRALQKVHQVSVLTDGELLMEDAEQHRILASQTESVRARRRRTQFMAQYQCRIARGQEALDEI